MTIMKKKKKSAGGDTQKKKTCSILFMSKVGPVTIGSSFTQDYAR